MSSDTAPVSIAIATAAAMETLGAVLARSLPRGACTHLVGPLAAGKTTLARGYLRALGHEGAVKSPTYTLVESYHLASARVHHFDLYRLADATELEFIGIDTYFDDGADTLVEWPERGSGVLPVADLVVTLALDGSARGVRLTATDADRLEQISNLIRSSLSDS